MMTKTIEKKDYLGNKICKGQKEDKSCPKFDVNSGKECPDPWQGEKDWKTNMDWECEEVIETETVSVMSTQARNALTPGKARRTGKQTWTGNVKRLS